MTRAFPGPGRKNSFTLIELLIVIFIIAILAALTLMASEGVMKAASRNRARAEIQAMSANLENFKADNGIYPVAATFNSTASYAGADGSLYAGVYQQSSQLLYQALSGQTNFMDQPVAGTKVYMTFKANQLGNAKAAAGTSGAGSTYIQDPFGYSYGYYTGEPAPAGTSVQVNPPNNGSGSYDLWSTGDALSTTLNPTASWISNWVPQ